MTAPLPASTDGLAVLRQLSEVRLVAMDIDGTLLGVPSGRVADVIADLNRSLRHYTRGVTLTVATGRAFAGARPILERLQLSRRTPVILYNGAVVCRSDGLGLSRLHTLEKDHLGHLIELTLAAGLSALVYEADLALPLRGDLENGPLVERVRGFAREPGPPTEFNGLAVEWTISPTDVPATASAAVIPTPRGESEILLASLAETDGLSVTRSSTAYLEVRPRGANKGDALAVIAAERSLAPASVLAIGDSDNDIEMLRWAGCSVAVANSTPDVLAACDYRTSGVAGEGVVETLRLLYDARRHRLRP
jgi:Cof subfamily protein (haloacid dehalogenase superfamily)